jgi:hypothetical protein
MLLPNRESPYIETSEPNLAKARTENDDPMMVVFKILKELPRRDIPYTDNAEPILAKFLMLIALPRLK